MVFSLMNSQSFFRVNLSVDTLFLQWPQSFEKQLHYSVYFTYYHRSCFLRKVCEFQVCLDIVVDIFLILMMRPELEKP